MPFTVSRTDGGAKDAEFEAYARLLRQQGVDLGKLPRAPEPETGRRWLYVWQNQEDAEAFAKELNKRTRDSHWAVIAVESPPSEGPMGPIIAQVGRRSTGLVFELHPLSRTMIQSAYPAANLSTNTVSINFTTLQDFTTTHGSIEELAAELLPVMTGLPLDELQKLGYALIEDGTDRTLVYVKPGEIAQV